MTARLARLVVLALLALLAACGGSPKKKKVVVTSETVVEILDPITFTGEGELTPGSYKTLDAIAATLVGNPGILLVEVQVYVLEGDEATRQELADRRARVVVDYLVGKQVAASRLVPQGYVTPPEDEPRSGVRFFVVKRAPTE
jgi:ABC-type glycerol-3-phosphate transport system substrate-binding protein